MGIKKAWNTVPKWARLVIPYLLFAIQLFMLDLSVRVFAQGETTYSTTFWLPNVFTLSFVFLFIGIVAFLKNLPKKIVYTTIIVVFLALAITQITIYSQTSFAFSFQNMAMAGEGGDYILDSLIAVVSKNPVSTSLIITVIVLIPIVLCAFSNQQDFILLPLLVGIILFFILNSICLIDCGMLFPRQATNSYNSTFSSKYKDVFYKFDERYDCIKIGGLYEYTLRDITTPSQRIDKNINADEKEFMDNHFSDETNSPNDHTGIFAGKNVIFLQLEGMDSWLLNEQNTPNLYALKNNSIDFVNHYSNAIGAGSTINNEMAANTGYYMPLGSVSNLIFLTDNNFKTTLPGVFKSHDYRSNVFHMNKGSFYSRRTIAKHLGYDNYFGLRDIVEDSDYLQLDRALIENETFNNQMFKSNQPFMHYLITYTPHAPYQYAGKGKLLADEKFGDNAKNQISNFKDTDFARLDAAETDKMVGELIEALKENNLYDNTVIVAYADHYQYSMTNSNEEQTKYGDVIDLANQTPFFIWSANTKPEKVEKINMQIDIMPTVLNMFGFSFQKDSIIGRDIFDSSQPGVAFFQNKSFFDGQYYYKNDEVFSVDPATRKSSSTNYKNEQLKKYVNDLIAKNDIALLHDYIR